MAEVTVPEQAGKFLAQVAGYVGTRTVDVGIRTGLIAELAKHPEGITVERLAEQTSTDPFYAGVWCNSALGAEIIDAVGDGYALAPHVATLLLDQDSPAFMGALFSVIDQPEVFDRFAEVLPTGERMWWNDTSPEWIRGVSGTGRAFYNRLIPAGLERVPGLTTSLNEGARVAELAVGAGVGLIKLAQTYPSITLVGVDGDAYSLELAGKNLAEAGVAHIELRESTLEDFVVDGEFDVVIINISMHECRDIEKVTANVKRSLAPGGVFVISDFAFPEGPEAFRTPPARVMLGIQVFEAQIDDQLLPTRAFVELLERHGFEGVGAIDVTPLHAITYGRA